MYSRKTRNILTVILIALLIFFLTYSCTRIGGIFAKNSAHTSAQLPDASMMDSKKSDTKTSTDDANVTKSGEASKVVVPPVTPEPAPVASTTPTVSPAPVDEPVVYAGDGNATGPNWQDNSDSSDGSNVPVAPVDSTPANDPAVSPEQIAKCTSALNAVGAERIVSLEKMSPRAILDKNGQPSDIFLTQNGSLCFWGYGHGDAGFLLGQSDMKKEQWNTFRDSLLAKGYVLDESERPGFYRSPDLDPVMGGNIGGYIYRNGSLSFTKSPLYGYVKGF